MDQQNPGILLAIIFFCLPAATIAQTNDIGSFSGTVFGDYYWMINNHLNQSPNDLEGANGFRFRRIYFTHEYELGVSFSTRLRMEMKDPGDYSSSISMTPDVKDAYLKWKPGRHAYYLGISESPTWSLVEDVWGYRSIERSPLDLQAYGSSRDFGISARGPLNEQATFRYHAMIGNGAGTRSEINQGKKAMLSLSYYPNDELVLEVYGDYNKRPGTSKWTTVQAFAGYQTNELTLGGLFAHQFRNNLSNQTIISVFTHFPVNEQMKTIFRVDHTFEPNPAGPSISYLPFSSNAEATFLLGAVDIQPIEEVNVHFMPNIEVIFYSDPQQPIVDTPDTDLMARLTFSYGF